MTGPLQSYRSARRGPTRLTAGCPPTSASVWSARSKSEPLATSEVHRVIVSALVTMSSDRAFEVAARDEFAAQDRVAVTADTGCVCSSRTRFSRRAVEWSDPNNDVFRVILESA